MTIEPYNYNDEPSGRTDTLTQALDRCERLEKQLKIALSSMRDSRELFYQLSQIEIADAIGKQLQQIKELENVSIRLK